jgi:hypothetical protein
MSLTLWQVKAFIRELGLPDTADTNVKTITRGRIGPGSVVIDAYSEDLVIAKQENGRLDHRLRDVERTLSETHRRLVAAQNELARLRRGEKP